MRDYFCHTVSSIINAFEKRWIFPLRYCCEVSDYANVQTRQHIRCPHMKAARICREKLIREIKSCRLARALAARINDTQISIEPAHDIWYLSQHTQVFRSRHILRSSHKWHTNRQPEILVPLLHCRATKAQDNTCKCADSPESSLLSLIELLLS